MNTLVIAGLILFLLWLLGLISSHTLDGGIHILLIVAVIVLILGLASRRK
jgi:hypothetical protein